MAIRDNVRSAVKVSRKTFFNPKAWIDWDGLKWRSVFLWTSVKDTVSIPTPTRTETFEEALKRMEVTQEQADQIGKRFFWFALFFVLCALLSFAYAFFLLFRHHGILASLATLCVSVFFVAQAVRFHFWYYEIKERRLGVTFAEWKKHVLGS